MVPYTDRQLRRIANVAFRHVLRDHYSTGFFYTKRPEFSYLSGNFWQNYSLSAIVDMLDPDPIEFVGQVRHGPYGRQGVVLGTINFVLNYNQVSIEWWYYAGRYDYRVDKRKMG